jgi:CheY-like chemotaxis protein
MPGMSSFEVCEALKAEPGLAEVPVIFVTAHAEPAFDVAGLAIGAADLIAKPVHAELVRAHVQADPASAVELPAERRPAQRR